MGHGQARRCAFQGEELKARVAGNERPGVGEVWGGARHAGAPARGPTIALGRTTKGDEFTAPQLART